MTKKQEKAILTFNETTKTLIDMFTSDNFPTQIARTLTSRKEGSNRPIDNWSLGNALLATAQGVTDGRTFNQWTAVERTVKKGSYAKRIFAPITKKITDKDKETGEETERYIVKGYYPMAVFDIADTEGKELPNDYKPKKFLLPALHKVADLIGVKVNYGAYVGQDFSGCYIPSEEKINLFTVDEKVFLHELSHAIDIKFVHNSGNYEYDRGEVTAELSSIVLMNMYGKQGYEKSSKDYIMRYYAKIDKTDSKNVVKAIMSVIADVEKIVNIVLDKAAEEYPTAAAV